MDEILDMCQHCTLVAQKAKCMLLHSKGNVVSRWREVILFSHETPPEFSAQETHGLVRVWLFSLEKRGLQGDIPAFQSLKGVYNRAGDGLFMRLSADKTSGNGFKLKLGRFRIDARKKFFTRRWNRFHREAVDTPSLEIFKLGLVRVLSNLM